MAPTYPLFGSLSANCAQMDADNRRCRRVRAASLSRVWFPLPHWVVAQLGEPPSMGQVVCCPDRSATSRQSAPSVRAWACRQTRETVLAVYSTEICFGLSAKRQSPVVVARWVLQHITSRRPVHRRGAGAEASERPAVRAGSQDLGNSTAMRGHARDSPGHRLHDDLPERLRAGRKRARRHSVDPALQLGL